jgi:hypothetical protein
MKHRTPMSTVKFLWKVWLRLNFLTKTAARFSNSTLPTEPHTIEYGKLLIVP